MSDDSYYASLEEAIRAQQLSHRAAARPAFFANGGYATPPPGQLSPD